ncbi:hypothetical protein Q428_13180 [Fervidicella metallireducens AeB]|uniref:Uncharacterized protein n=1 Tax=Fervidicella metallireducens AeB TaxID=1403537 RepID=A0A017RS91_9CLOT|nr:hypothetical protein [Fervidicella metallireducens]EYE87461.1 hypothetical protein Q428_13180 [Fervidicella metallireducens AeB]
MENYKVLSKQFLISVNISIICILVVIMIIKKYFIWDKVIVPGYDVYKFVQTVEKLNTNYDKIKIVEIAISGEPNIAQHMQIRDNDYKYLLNLSQKYPRVKVTSFMIRGRLSYNQYYQIRKMGDFKGLYRYYLIPRRIFVNNALSP